jgi:ribosome recycling factor
MIPLIEKAILTSDLGLNPANDGALIRVPIPKLTGERRQELVRMVKRSAEEHKVVVRNYRRDSNDTVKMLQKESEISEDDMHRTLKIIQDRTDQTIKGIDAQVDAKEKEILEI